MELIREDGRVAGLYDICDWWIYNYPADIFVNQPKEVVEIRMLMRKILLKRKRVIPSSKSKLGKD